MQQVLFFLEASYNQKRSGGMIKSSFLHVLIWMEISRPESRTESDFQVDTIFATESYFQVENDQAVLHLDCKKLEKRTYEHV